MELFEIIKNAPENSQLITDSIVITHAKLKQYDKILCSVSGGSDSDILVDLCQKFDDADKITAAVEKCAEEADVILTTGGVSVGVKDLLPEIMKKLAKDKMLRAKSNVAYAKGTYEKEMEQAALKKEAIKKNVI